MRLGKAKVAVPVFTPMHSQHSLVEDLLEIESTLVSITISKNKVFVSCKKTLQQCISDVHFLYQNIYISLSRFIGG